MGLGELWLWLIGDSGDLVAAGAGPGSSSEGVGTRCGGGAAFWGAAGVQQGLPVLLAWRSAWRKQGWVAES